MSKELLVGVDLGTTKIKMGIFDLEGNVISRSEYAYVTSSNRKGWVEQNPDDWWNAFKKVAIETTSKVDGKHISAICCGGQSPTLVSVGRDGHPVRPAIIWSDQRATEEARVLTKKLNQPVDPTTLLPKVLWIKRNEEKRYEKTKYFMQVWDYINYHLIRSDEFAISGLRNQWVSEQIEDAGLDLNKIPEFKPIGKLVGTVTSEASKKTGLPVGTPVVGGTVDFYLTVAGVGAIEKGIGVDMAATSEGVALCWDKPIDDSLGRIISFPHPHIKDLWMCGGVMSSAGKSLEWFKNNFYGTEVQYERVISDASSVSPGSNNLIFLPYLTGERYPIHDPYARAVFFGISIQHTKQHFTRAVIESVAYVMKQFIDAIKEGGGKFREIRTCGGQAHSDIWNQIKADVWNLPVSVPNMLYPEMLGAAMVAGLAIKKYNSIEESCKKMIKIKKTMKPNSDNHQKYCKIAKVFNKLYPYLKEEFHELSGEEGQDENK